MDEPHITPAMLNRDRPRAEPAAVQQVIDLWKAKNNITGPATAETKGAFRVFCYRAAQHFFTPHDVFNPASWSVEDVRLCLEALK